MLSYCTNTNTKKQNVLTVIELFSGIGGFHVALKSFIESSKTFKNYKLNVYPFDNNCNANKLYQHNFNIKPLNKNIEHLNAKYFDVIKPFIITLSPPCQPYTRCGNQKGSNDQRANALHHFSNQILPKLKYLPNYIMLENVIGFETSKSCQIFLNSLIQCKYQYNIYSINSTQIGMPNTRKRIYILAKFNANNHHNDNHDKDIDITFDIITKLPIQNVVNQSIGEIIKMGVIENDNKEETNDNTLNEKYLVSMDKIAKCKGYKFDIVTINDYDSECFTKSYATKKNYSKGTGSLFASQLVTNNEIIQFNNKYKQLFTNKLDINHHQQVIQLLSKVGLRYFTPKEMSLLMGFPMDFLFPNDMNDSQIYKLLGNSINIHVVALLLSILIGT